MAHRRTSNRSSNRADWWLPGNSSWAATAVAALATCLCACTPLPRYEVRPARSSLGCMRSALAAQGPLPAVDSQAHCLAAGLIARHCSITEAWLASLGKEVLDLLGPGDAEWHDLAADGQGIACARRVPNDAALEACCKQEGDTRRGRRQSP